MKRVIIGIDCAVDEKKRGLARGLLDGDTLTVHEVTTGSRDRPAVEIVKSWIGEDTPTLLALDAPLGWPAALGTALTGHRAGQPLPPPDANLLFRRATDRFVECKGKGGPRPLDVGANLIARTAYAALELLEKLRQKTKKQIPLAWDPADLKDEPVAIEVYPAATLAAYRFESSRYKRKEDGAIRAKILKQLAGELTLPDDLDLPTGNPDALDAVVCVLAGRDFLLGEAYGPEDMDLAQQEGWIWVRKPGPAGG
jgi:predicted RNase H-like nuclease